MSDEDTVGVTDKRMKELEDIVDGALKQLQLAQQRIVCLETTVVILTGGKMAEPQVPKGQDGCRPVLTVNVPRASYLVRFNEVDPPKASALVTAKAMPPAKLVQP